MAVDQIPSDSDELNDLDFGEIHVTLKQPDQVFQPGRYRLIFQDYKPQKSQNTGAIGANATFVFDADRHKEMGKRKIFENFWFTPGSMWRYTNFLVCAGCNPELMREEPVVDANGNQLMDEDGKVVTKCAYGVKEQLSSIISGGVWADIETEEYLTKDVDGITDIKRKRSKIARFVKG